MAVYHFSENLKPWLLDQAIFASNIAAPNKAKAIELMVRMLLERRGYTHDEMKNVALEMLRREELGTTGVGMGFAYPHTASETVTDVEFGWFSFCPPLDFNSLDGDAVSFVCCGIFPRSRPGDKLRTHEAVSQLVFDLLREADMSGWKALDKLFNRIMTCGGTLEL